jgi:hypothetical protein
LTLVRWGQPLPGEIRELLSQPVTKYTGPIGPYNDSNPQSTALLAAIRMGPEAAENLPDILAIFNEKSNRWYLQPRMALEVLRNMKSVALAAAPRLFELFDESKGSYRSEIGWTLIEIGADRQELIGRLIPLLADRDGDECRTAGWLLAHASPDEGRRQVSALIPKISPDQVAQQRSGLHAISGLIRVAQEAIPSLTVLLDQPLDDFSFLRLADTLGAIGPDAVSAVPALIGLLERDPATLKISHRLAIIRSLAGIGPAARPAVPALLLELKTIKTHHNSAVYDKREQVNSLPSVIRALALVGSTDAEVFAALQGQLASDDDDTSSAALDALLQLSPESPDLLIELLHRRPGSAYPGRELWTFAITRMTCDRREAVGPITDVLRNADPEARKLAAWALGAIGSEARAALPALHDALADWENSLYMARANMRRYVDNSLQDQINGSNRIRSSLFAAYYAKRIELQAPSVRDVVREAILRIDPEADLQEASRQ